MATHVFLQNVLILIYFYRRNESICYYLWCSEKITIFSANQRFHLDFGWNHLRPTRPFSSCVKEAKGCGNQAIRAVALLSDFDCKIKMKNFNRIKWSNKLLEIAIMSDNFQKKVRFPFTRTRMISDFPRVRVWVKSPTYFSIKINIYF